MREANPIAAAIRNRKLTFEEAGIRAKKIRKHAQKYATVQSNEYR
jgi:hypothetical protein